MKNIAVGEPAFDVVVAGGGPVGMSAALAFAGAGLKTALVAPDPPPAGTATEARTAALFTPQLRLLERIGVWDACRAASAPLSGIRIIDQTSARLKAPEVLFEAREIGQDVFGYNVPNGPLAAALRAAVSAEPNVTCFQPASVVSFSAAGDGVQLGVSDGRAIRARLVVAADGRNSFCRQAAGIGADVRETGQVAITAVLTHSRPHRGISTEFHRSAGPLTVVPMVTPEPGQGQGQGPTAGRHASALVWIERAAVATRLLTLDDATFRACLSSELGGLLGDLHGIGPRTRFELSFVRARQLVAPRLMLVGEAAHVMPPIGAQGLNLSLRDVAAAVDAVAAARAGDPDPGHAEVLAAYERDRRRDIMTRVGAIEALNASLLADLTPVHLLRGAGLHVLSAVPVLRRQLMRIGLGGEAGLPSLMR